MIFYEGNLRITWGIVWALVRTLLTVSVVTVQLGCGQADYAIRTSSASNLSLPNQESFSLKTMAQSNVPREVRLLIVIDNSGSMGVFQSKVAAGFRAFAEKFLVPGVKMSIAVITSDYYLDPNPISGLRPILYASKYSDAGQLEALVKTFSNLVTVGQTGNGDERVLQSLDRYLTLAESNPAVSLFTPYAAEDPLHPVANIVLAIQDEHSHDLISTQAGVSIDHTLGVINKLSDDDLKAHSTLLAKGVKSKLDSFFKGLRGSAPGAAADANYSYLSVTNQECRAGDGTRCGLLNGLRDNNERWGIEHVALVDLMKQDTTNSSAKLSATYDINQSSYETMFTGIGSQIYSQISMRDRVSLKRDVFSLNDFYADLVLSSGQRILLGANELQIVSPRSLALKSSLIALIPDSDMGAHLDIRYR